MNSQFDYISTLLAALHDVYHVTTQEKIPSWTSALGKVNLPLKTKQQEH